MRAMFRRRDWAISLFSAAVLEPAVIADPVIFARGLALSPDGKSLAFTWAGDIWSAASEGGVAKRLTVHPAEDADACWSPDGHLLAFSSNRNGADNVYSMTAEGGSVTRVTFGDRPETPSGWSPDGEMIYYHARKDGEVPFEPRMYRVPAAGGQAWRMLECVGSCARVSPNGKHMVFTRGWSPFARTGYRGPANHDAWTYEFATGRFSQLTNFKGSDLYPVWSADSAGVYVLSDRPGRAVDGAWTDARAVHNVWFVPLDGGEARQVTFASGERVRDFSVSGDGRRLAYTQWDKIFVVDLSRAGEAGQSLREIHIEAGDDSSLKPAELRTFSRDADEIEPSPDGKEIALVVRGEIFVIRTEPEKPTRRVTNGPARDRDVTWSPDGKALFFVSDREGQEDIYRATSAENPAKALADSLRFKIERVTDNPQIERSPSVAPDGKTLAFSRNRGDLMLRDLKSGSERRLFESWNQPQFRWSPDSKWLLYAIEDEEFNADVWIAAADGSGEAVNISQHPDNDVNPQWSADGQIVAFSSKRQSHDSDLFFVFLSPDLHEKSTVDLNAYFEKAAEKCKKRKPLGECVASAVIALGTQPSSAPTSQSTTTAAPASSPSSAPTSRPAWLDVTRAALRELLKEDDNKDKSKDKSKGDKNEKPDKAEKEETYAWDLKTAYRRLRAVSPLPQDQSNFALSPDGATIAFTSGHEGTPALFGVKWNGEDRKKWISSAVGGLQWPLDGQRLFYLKAGVPGSCKDGGGDAKDHAFSARIQIDYAAEIAQKFEDAARTFALRFYHPTMKGIDWPARVGKFRALATRVRSNREFNQIFDFLQGELNASHLGISGPPGGGAGNESVGYLGVDFDPTYTGPGLRVLHVLKNSPADRVESRLYRGDILLKINGIALSGTTSIEKALLNTVSEQTIVEYTPSPTRPASQPVSQPASGPAPQTSTQAATKAVSQPASPPSSDPKSNAQDPIPVGDGASRTAELVIRPISSAAFTQLRYQEWVDANAAYVAEKSGSRVAYTHISGMAEPQFHVFERDLYAVAHKKDGLIIDVRNNGGGWTADWVLAVLNVRRHAYTQARGGPAGYPQDRLIFYSWTKPATMMCNQYSYSNAEIISHAFKNLKRGPLVGMQTFGAVISTGAFQLIDGTNIRMPFRGWYTIPGDKDMEDEGARPDLLILESPDDEHHGRRPQLDAAIRATLEQLEEAATGENVKK